jgi:hypothetical protein
MFSDKRSRPAFDGGENLAKKGFIATNPGEDRAFVRRTFRFSGLWGGHVAAAFDADTAAGRNIPK